ncbi:hypothetical protein [Chondromyces apiculatus]|nr:hypothetical protein [Chondromyces apiculatus]
MSTRIRSIATMAIVTAGTLLSGVAQAGFTVCATGRATTIDSGHDIPNGPNAGFTVVVRSIASDGGAGANVVRLHDDPYTFTSSPGGFWAYVFNNQTLSQNTTSTYTNIGSGVAKWTAFFAANQAMRTYDDHLDNVELNVGIDESCTAGGSENLASAHYGSSGSSRSNGQITSGIHHLGIANCASTNFTDYDNDNDNDPTRAPTHQRELRHQGPPGDGGALHGHLPPQLLHRLRRLERHRSRHLSPTSPCPPSRAPSFPSASSPTPPPSLSEARG